MTYKTARAGRVVKPKSEPRERSDDDLEGRAREGWLPFVDSYRTLCLAPSPEARVAFDQLGASGKARFLSCRY
jgi:hypothetical protein